MKYYFKDIELEGLDGLSTVSVSSSIPWTKQHAVVELKQVQQNSGEWLDIVKRIRATLQGARIYSLHRIQNKWLWDAYMQSKKRLSIKNRDMVNERLLFHGTRNNPPEKIYKSEKGFDFRFAGQGLWGEGTYFAVNASYSHNYAYTESTNGCETKQMFLALVLTGESCSCPEDRALKKPPLKPRHNQMFADERYDSIQGHTGGSEIFVIYEHDKAYPAYLIKYT